MNLFPALTAGLAVLLGAIATLWHYGLTTTEVYVGLGIGAFIFVGVAIAVLLERPSETPNL